MTEWINARGLEKAKCDYDKTSIVQKTDTMTIRKQVKTGIFKQSANEISEGKESFFCPVEIRM